LGFAQSGGPKEQGFLAGMPGVSRETDAAAFLLKGAARAICPPKRDQTLWL
jgi:hypothetical protein